jgi:hypothetical protein
MAPSRRSAAPRAPRALAERLLTFPASPLWGGESRRLAEELARIKFLLVDDQAMSGGK